MTLLPMHTSGYDNDKFSKRNRRIPLFRTVLVLSLLSMSGVLWYRNSSIADETPLDQTQLPQLSHNVIPMVNAPTNAPLKEDLNDAGRQQAVNHNLPKATTVQVEQGLYRQKRVKQAFEHAWKGYKQYAWGYDHLVPLQQKGDQWFYVGLTIADSLDTAMIMGFNNESALLQHARHWIQHELQWNGQVHANVFELTIRVLGGYLSAYELEKDQLYLDKARELADRLVKCFQTDSGFPLASYDFHSDNCPNSFESLSTAEVATLQLEWRYLSYLTGDVKYWKAVENVMKGLLVDKDQAGRVDGLVPIFINGRSGLFEGVNYRLGSRGDSYYEYLLKQWFQTGFREDLFRRRFEEAMDGVLKHLVRTTAHQHLVYVGEYPSGLQGEFSPKMDHLVCFLPGTLMLYVTRGNSKVVKNQLSPKLKEYFEFAEQLMRTCYMMYQEMPSGLAPEIVYFHEGGEHPNDFIVQPQDAFSILRPETVESLFYVYRLTGEEKYREWAWTIFESVEKHAKVPGGGYACLSSILLDPPPQDSGRRMESFFLAETLKYLYLLFDQDDARFPLDRYVFNTEAHPLPLIDWESPHGRVLLNELKRNQLGLFDIDQNI